MKPDLGKEVEELVQKLKESRKINLVRQIEENWDKNVLEYSKRLNSWEPTKKMEPELIEAFNKELLRLDFPLPSLKKILSSLEKRRILQTTPHIVPIEGPRMLCADWLGSLAVPENEFYIVGMFSGVSFSNNFRPGRISSKKGEINLFPSSMQDAMVYRSKIPAKLLEKFDMLPEQLKKILPLPELESSYTKWALRSCQKVQRRVLEKNNLVYLDMNEVIAHYLIQILKNPSHLIHKIFFDTETRQKFIKEFPNEAIFYFSIQNGKYEVMENLFLSEKNLKSKHREISLHDPKVLIQEIRDNGLCPSLLLIYIALVSLNQFKCFGSFAQTERFPSYQEKLENLDFMKKFQGQNLQTASLTTGAFSNETDLFPSDLIVENKKLIQNENCLFGELLINMKDRLMENYLPKNE